MARRGPRRAAQQRESVQRLEFRRRLLLSAGGHALVVAAFALSPAPAARPLPSLVTVDLIAHLPSAPSRAAALPAASPKPRKIVLPREAPPARAKPVVQRRKPRELDYDDALAKLRDELGESVPEPAPDQPEHPAELADASAGSGSGTLVSQEMAAWIRDTKRHVRQTYVTPPEFLNRGLTTCMQVLLGADGSVMGAPAVRRGSGDPFWDDNAARAVVRASPLPAPPSPGEFTFCVPSEERE